ncbi:MAG: M23 family metallopeptidase [Acidimicrobiia bacterium]
MLSVPAAQAGVTGGAVIPDELTVREAFCADGTAWACRQGQQLTITGTGMNGVKAVEFLGKAGSRDDRRVRPLRVATGELVVIVPRGARSGRLRARSVTSGVVMAPRSVSISPPARAAGTDVELPEITADGVFPIRGIHDMGVSAANRFGGGRGHQGQDMFADCGTPLVAVRDGSVQSVGRQAYAGNYVVLQAPNGESYVYMHMKSRALVSKGDLVTVGQPVGYVGKTGRATGCHLHFELWTTPGRHTVGHPVDPLAQLKRWEAADSGHR